MQMHYEVLTTPQSPEVTAPLTRGAMGATL